MTADEFKPGDQVQLASGGPVMTVGRSLPRYPSDPNVMAQATARNIGFASPTLSAGDRPTELVEVAWFDGVTLYAAAFAPGMLSRVVDHQAEQLARQKEILDTLARIAFTDRPAPRI